MEKMERSFRPLVRSLRREAADVRGVPEHVVVAAARAVDARFAEYAECRLDDATRRRVIAYFWGAIRRHAVRHAPGYARNIVRATMTADLEQAGWDFSAIGVELERLGLSA